MKITSYIKLNKLQEYLTFINECSIKTYDTNLVLHKHHIYPSSLMNKVPDITEEMHPKYFKTVKLSVDDHITAHVMMSKCFEEGSYEYKSNLQSARLLSRKSIKYRNEINKLYEYQKGDNNPARDPEVRKKISEKLKGRTSKNKGKTYEDIYGINSERQRNKRKKCSRSKESYEAGALKARATRLAKGISQSGDKNGFAKPLYIDGIYYESIKDACLKLDVSAPTLHRRYNIVYKNKNDNSY